MLTLCGFANNVLRCTALRNIKTEGFAYIDLLANERSDKSHRIRMFNVSDRTHLSEDISNGIKLVFKFCFPDIPEIAAQDLCNEQDEQPACLSTFRPVSLSVGTHKAFHHTEVLQRELSDMLDE